MSSQVPATSRRLAAVVAGLILSSVSGVAVGAEPASSAAADVAEGSPTRTDRSSVAAPVEALIVRVFVNTVSRGNVAVLRDVNGDFLIPAAEYTRWGLSLPGATPVQIGGEQYIRLGEVHGLDARFDTATVTLHLQAAAGALSGTTIDLRPKRRTGVLYPADASVFLNYGLSAAGDESFGNLRYEAATELGARLGNWLFYNTTDHQWGPSNESRLTRLLTNAQYDDRPNLRRLTLGDFFTAGFDLSSSVPMGGVSLTKDYSMDPYFIQYPTAAFRTEVAFPSTLQVRVDGNLIAQRQVQPGPVDIANITGVTGARNVSVVIRDPFGREQVLQQPFFFATNVGLAEGLHEYSYNLGWLRRDYGLESNDYGDPALAAFHRYAFTNRLTLGLRGQATRDLYNVGPFGTYQFPRFGVVAGGVSLGGRDGALGHAVSAGYSYTGLNFSVNLGTRYFSRDFGQLADLTSGFRQRSDRYVSASAYSNAAGSLTATYSASDNYDGPPTEIINLSYSLATLGGRGLLSASYVRTLEPASGYFALLSYRYFVDQLTSAVAAAGAGRGSNTQSVSLQRSIPQGQGLGYEVTAGRAGGDGPDAAFGRGFVQFNAPHAELGAEYARSSRADGGPGFSRAFVAGSIGSVGGSAFLARPVEDSFALVRLPGLADVPVFANGWYAGRTNSAGEVVATNLSSYYDNYINFGAKDLPFDYVFPSSEKVISPPSRSGTLVTFEVRKVRAVYGVLVEQRNGVLAPLEFREMTVTRGANVVKGFTARRGEFYVEGVEPGEHMLQLNNGASCTARLRVPDDAGAMTDVGTLTCVPTAR
jgi:outer membrane usher protein FimD/PapC